MNRTINKLCINNYRLGKYIDLSVQVKIYNLGTGTGVTVLQIVKAFEEATGKKIPYEIVDRWIPIISSIGVIK